MITVGEMQVMLAKYDPSKPLIMSKDIEGNGYSPLAYVEEGEYEATSTWSGEVHFPENEDDHTGGVQAIVLFPVN